MQLDITDIVDNVRVGSQIMRGLKEIGALQKKCRISRTTLIWRIAGWLYTTQQYCGEFEIARKILRRINTQRNKT